MSTAAAFFIDISILSTIDVGKSNYRYMEMSIISMFEKIIIENIDNGHILE